LWGRVVSSVISVLVQSAIVTEERPGGMSRSDADAWWAALALPARPSFPGTPAPAEIRGLIKEAIGPSLPRLMNWIATASLDDLLELTPPSAVIPESPDSGFPDDELDAQYSWAVDHFSSTFYSEWSTSSLHYAYRWLSGHEIPPCNPDLMSDRRIDSAKLNAEIARRAASRKTRPPRRPMRHRYLRANDIVKLLRSLSLRLLKSLTTVIFGIISASA
jgi:hypothetical protein